MGRILGEDNVTCELAWGKPEGEVWWLVQLELSMDPETRWEPSAPELGGRDCALQTTAERSDLQAPESTAAGERFGSKSFSCHTKKKVKLEQIPRVSSVVGTDTFWKWAVSVHPARMNYIMSP